MLAYGMHLATLNIDRGKEDVDYQKLYNKDSAPIYVSNDPPKVKKHCDLWNDNLFLYVIDNRNWSYCQMNLLSCS